jgi:hypothetical protein
MIDGDTMKFGLLMESAQAHQRMAESHLQKLRAHTEDLDGVVRDEIRRTFVDEFRLLSAETEKAAMALREMKHAVNLRGLSWNVGTAVLCMAAAGAVAHCVLPSQSQIDAMRAERDSLALNLSRLQQLGGKVDWHHCGSDARLCVRIDRKAPAYGEQSDYFIVKGY